jgi:outer membrane protein OmpA-like peptidoglycan-associated protein
MRNSGMAVLVGALLLGATGASAQQLAAATAPQHDIVVFADKGTTLSPTARDTVAKAAEKANGAPRVTLVGRAANVAPVKAELQRNGVPAERIAVRSEARAPIAKAADGLSNPVDRRVEIKF